MIRFRFVLFAVFSVWVVGCAGSDEFARSSLVGVWNGEVTEGDATYRTSGDRGLSGHSFGGLFATYVLFEAPDLFQRVGINSPSLWWNDGEMFAAEAAFAETHTALPVHVFLSLGSEEGSAMVPPMERFAEALRSRAYGGLTVDAMIFEDESHASVVPAMMSRTLRVLYRHQN